MKENAIIIDGVKHTLVKDRRKEDENNCLDCSLYDCDMCNPDKEYSVCIFVFEVLKHHFEILKQE